MLIILARSTSDEEKIVSRMASRRVNLGRDDFLGEGFLSRLGNVHSVDIGLLPILSSRPVNEGNYSLCIFLGFVAVQALVGALYAAAWYSHFPTVKEHRIWWVSCIIVAIADVTQAFLGLDSVSNFFACMAT